MIWTILIILIPFIAVRFIMEIFKDNKDLNTDKLDEKFSTIVNTLNNHVFNGNGEVHILDKRSFNLYEKGTNQIVTFFYSTGNLQITWRCKYLQKETVHEELYADVRNINLVEQQNIANDMIEKISIKIQQL